MSTPETSRRAVDPAMLSAIPDAVKAAPVAVLAWSWPAGIEVEAAWAASAGGGLPAGT